MSEQPIQSDAELLVVELSTQEQELLAGGSYWGWRGGHGKGWHGRGWYGRGWHGRGWHGRGWHGRGKGWW